MVRRDQVLVSGVALMIALISVAPIFLQQRIINDAVEGKALPMLIWLCGLYFGVIIIRLGLKYLLGIYQTWIAQSVIKAERDRLSAHFAAKEETAIQKMNDEENSTGVGKAVAVISKEIDTIGTFVGSGLSDLVADGCKLLFAIGYMLWVDPRIAFLASAFILPQLIIVPLMQRSLNKLIRQRTDQLRDLSEDVTELRDDEAELSGDYLDKLDDIFDNRMKAAAIKFGIKMIVNFLNALAPLSVLLFGGYLFIQGETTLGTMVADVASSALAPPAIICVGKSVLMRQVLDWQGMAAGDAPRNLDPLGRGRPAESA